MKIRLFALTLLALSGLGVAACAAPYASQIPLSEQTAAGGERYQGIRLLGTLRLPDTTVDGLTLGGLSGLAWDARNGLLYAVSDNAKLFHIRPIFNNGMLVDALLIAAYPLRDAKGQPLYPPFADAEGLTIDEAINSRPGNEPDLFISFEVKPRVVRYTPTGKWLGTEPLPFPLRDIHRYADPNKALEALTLHPSWGLLTGPEWPMRNELANQVPIFALRGQRVWQYPLYPAPNSALVDMQALPDGSLLMLERAFVSPFHPLVIALRRTRLGSTTQLTVEDVAVFDSSQGWVLDNFEGLTRHQGRRFFMVSDNNFNLLQNTFLVYFELLSTPDDKADWP